MFSYIRKFIEHSRFNKTKSKSKLGTDFDNIINQIISDKKTNTDIFKLKLITKVLKTFTRKRRAVEEDKDKQSSGNQKGANPNLRNLHNDKNKKK